ncbi:unnamed protein product [Lactuca virosa]|uniref:TIR domain-containing protein n=1 Tax=Lactuca virosa TaxID=75947 RepID=A0AAU9MY93_9ASTR|nr:unnamed protein product [Lactuca virosa]
MKPTVSYFRVFGCVCYVFVPSHLRSKFDKKAVRCIFVGYDNQRKGWRCCDPTSGRCYTSRDVVFDEASSWWSLEKKVLPDSENIEEVLKQKMGEQTAHIWSSVDTPEDPSDTDVIKQEVTQTSNAGERETPPPQLRRTERIRKPNPKVKSLESVPPEFGVAGNLRFYWQLTSLCIKFLSLSFRGEDTRRTFVDHLYTALEQQGIYTYKDDETLPRGESIGPSLVKAIEESQIAVIIFSENYADSSWCLDELACIIKCKDVKGQIAMPIFYGVDPSEIRKQKRKIGEAFSNHELENKSKVDSWRKALVDVSNIAGWEPKHVANGHESKVIKEIADTISQTLKLVTSSANENLVGIVARMESLKLELQIGSGGVRMIGIWGVGGGGKTTLASSIYDEISSKFDGCFFVKNIREESSKNGLVSLQKKIISGVSKQKEVQGIERVEEGRRMIMGRLCHRKVLIVLDDVDRLDQLEALVGSHDWFGEGSRIIITTRDEHVLNAHRVNVTHNISLLNNDEAIKLFWKHARWDYAPMEAYEQLSKEVVSYAGGLPLALTILGSFLCDKNIKEWRSALARLKEIPNDNILETLKISFDGLAKVEKELFLDIACFFRAEEKDKAMEILEACGFHPVIGVKVLVQKTLITISDGRFDMHDLVQEMGHHIIRGEHPNNPGKHSRVWKNEDVLKICAMDATMGLDKIKAINMSFQSETEEEEEDLPSVAANMKNLRYMDSRGDPAKSLFHDLPPRELCCLILSSGLQKQLWEGCKFLPSLKLLKLHFMNNLIMTPDFNGLPNLERFNLYGCWCLKEIDPSIGCLEKLVFLSIEDCPSLEMFPPISGIKKLETLSFSGHIKLVNCSNLPGVECCVDEPGLCHNIRLGFFHNLQELSFLRKLNLRHRHLEDEDLGSDVLEFPNLQELNLEGNDFSRLSFSCLRLPRLKWLNVSSNEDLVELSELPQTIAVVKANYCRSLETLGDISNCKWLWKVSLLEDYKVDPLVGELLLDCMLQGNAIEDHFISFSIPHQIPKGFVGSFFRGKTFTKHLRHLNYYPVHNKSDDDTFRLHLPDDWCNDFCGFLIRIISQGLCMWMDISIKQDPDEEDSRFEIWQDHNESPEHEYGGDTSSPSQIEVVNTHPIDQSLAHHHLEDQLYPHQDTKREGSCSIPNTDDFITGIKSCYSKEKLTTETLAKDYYLGVGI